MEVEVWFFEVEKREPVNFPFRLDLPVRVWCTSTRHGLWSFIIVLTHIGFQYAIANLYIRIVGIERVQTRLVESRGYKHAEDCVCIGVEQ